MASVGLAAVAADPGGDEPASAESRLANAFGRVLAGTRPRDDVRIETECRAGRGYEWATVYGSGVGVWKGRQQLVLEAPVVRRLLEAFRRHGFFSMKDEGSAEAGPSGFRPATVTCSVALSIGADGRRVTDVDRRGRTAELERLAREILSASRRRGRSGLAVRSIEEGLRGVATGAVAEEVLDIVLQRPPERPGGDGGIVRMSGRWLSVESLPAGERDVPARGRLLSPGEGRALAARLVKAEVWRLPANLSLPGYANGRVIVFGRSHEIQARPFAGQTVDPGASARFDTVLRAPDQVQADGRHSPP